MNPTTEIAGHLVGGTGVLVPAARCLGHHARNCPRQRTLDEPGKRWDLSHPSENAAAKSTEIAVPGSCRLNRVLVNPYPTTRKPWRT